jgi:hypothetical protein
MDEKVKIGMAAERIWKMFPFQFCKSIRSDHNVDGAPSVYLSGRCSPSASISRMRSKYWCSS